MPKAAHSSRRQTLFVIITLSTICLVLSFSSLRLSTVKVNTWSAPSAVKTPDVAEVQLSDHRPALERKISDNGPIGIAGSLIKETAPSTSGMILEEYMNPLIFSSNDTSDQAVEDEETSMVATVPVITSEQIGRQAVQEKVQEIAQIPVSTSPDVKREAAEGQLPKTRDTDLSRYGGWISAAISEDIFGAYNACLVQHFSPRWCNMSSPTWSDYAWTGNPKAASDVDIRSLASQHLRGKKIVLIGDSLMRFQFMSFTCLLSSLGFEHVSSKNDTCSEFPEIDFRVCYPERMYVVVRSPTNMKTVRHKFKEAMEECPTYVVINTGAHWTESALQRECNGDAKACARAGFDDPLKTYGRALTAIAGFLKKFYSSKMSSKTDDRTAGSGSEPESESELELESESESDSGSESESESEWCKTSGGRRPTVIFQTSTVSHFRSISFVPGRGVVGHASCSAKTAPSTSEELAEFGTIPEFLQQQAVMKSWFASTNWKNVTAMLVDATPLSLHRSDAHPGHGVDCLHFCLPGVPDWINRVILHRIFRHEAHLSRKHLLQ